MSSADAIQTTREEVKRLKEEVEVIRDNCDSITMKIGRKYVSVSTMHEAFVKEVTEEIEKIAKKYNTKRVDFDEEVSRQREKMESELANMATKMAQLETAQQKLEVLLLATTPEKVVKDATTMNASENSARTQRAATNVENVGKGTVPQSATPGQSRSEEVHNKEEEKEEGVYDRLLRESRSLSGRRSSRSYGKDNRSDVASSTTRTVRSKRSTSRRNNVELDKDGRVLKEKSPRARRDGTSTTDDGNVTMTDGLRESLLSLFRRYPSTYDPKGFSKDEIKAGWSTVLEKFSKEKQWPISNPRRKCNKLDLENQRDYFTAEARKCADAKKHGLPYKPKVVSEEFATRCFFLLEIEKPNAGGQRVDSRPGTAPSRSTTRESPRKRVDTRRSDSRRQADRSSRSRSLHRRYGSRSRSHGDKDEYKRGSRRDRSTSRRDRPSKYSTRR